MAKMIPAASDSPADAQVWTWLASRMLDRRKKSRNSSIAITAAGMDADTVIPAFSPTYTLAAPITTDASTFIPVAKEKTATGTRISRGKIPRKTPLRS